MAKVTWIKPDRNDPMYKEGYRSYSPHWARPFNRPSSNFRTPPQGSRNGSQATKRGKPNSPR
jgi:hypothetical protein